MATLATTIQRKFEGGSSEPLRTGAERANPYQLRSLPNEDIFFHVKRIDNSRLVREADPRARAECWSTIGAVCAVAAVLITSLVPSVAGITAGYQIQALKQERQRLVDERRGLDVQEAALSGQQRLEQLARDNNMVNPKPEQIVHLNINAAEGTVASLAPQKVK
jgi:cell division protein FtsL